MIKCEIKGLNKLEKKLKYLGDNLTKKINEGLKRASDGTAEYAISLRRGNKSDGIIAELVELKTNSIKYRIHTQQDIFPYSWFEHYGTGKYAELSHVGTTKHFLASGYSEWFIPVSKVDKVLRYPRITINGVEFYLARGVKPNPFMQKAEFETRPQTLDEVEESIYQLIKEVCK